MSIDTRNNIQESDPIKNFINIMGGRWKLLIIRELINGPMRFGELRRSLGNITPKVLADALRSMETDGIVLRTIYSEPLLRVEYSLSVPGYRLSKIINLITSCLIDFQLSLSKGDNLKNEYMEGCDNENKNEIFYQSNLPDNYEEKNYGERLLEAKELISNAECLVVGTGSGINYKSGVDHFSRNEAKQLFPYLFDKGLTTIDEMINAFSQINRMNEIEYWRFWSKFIWKIRYNLPLSQEHENLAKLIQNKEYFLISTNSDGQLEKAGFSSEKIYSPLGSYSFLQCAFPCEDRVYDSKVYVEKILSQINNDIEIQKNIPHCPLCGEYLVPNHFRTKVVSLAKSSSQANRNTYLDYLSCIKQKKTVLLEIGCGFRMVEFIRNPFERLVNDYKNIYLIRINMKYPELEKKELKNKAVLFGEKVDVVLSDLVNTQLF